MVIVSGVCPGRYESHGNLGSDRGDRLYVDRDYVYTDVDRFSGCEHIRTANSDDKSGAVRFRVHCRCEVTVLFDARARRLPRWLESWAAEPEATARVRTTDGDRAAFSRVFEAGAVRLGSNSRRLTGARSMYTVLVRAEPAEPAESPLDAPPVDASSPDAPPVEAPSPDAPPVDASSPDAPPVEAPSAGGGGARDAREFPTTDALGVEVGGGWRVIVSEEGRDKRLWSVPELRECAASGMASWLPSEGALAWRPRFRRDASDRKWLRWKGNPSSTVWRSVPRASLAAGALVRMRFYSERREDLPKVDYDERWLGREHSASLRNVAGTGDFRVGLLQTDGRADPGEWHAFQVRIYPYLHRESRDYIGKNDASNFSYWYRREPGGGECLLDDYSQEGDRDGFKKLKHAGELKFGLGPHSPYGEFIDVEIELRAAGGRVHPRVRVHESEIALDAYEHESSASFGREFTHVDAVCWSFNNMRPYAEVKLVGLDW